jgi:hypothetical protein
LTGSRGTSGERRAGGAATGGGGGGGSDGPLSDSRLDMDMGLAERVGGYSVSAHGALLDCDGVLTFGVSEGAALGRE